MPRLSPPAPSGPTGPRGPAPTRREAVTRAFAKINLTLDILGRRPDGYHEVATVYQTVGLFDRLTITLSGGGRGPRIDVQTDDPTIPDGPGNLAHRAVGLLFKTIGAAFGVDIRIEKGIPTAAGLGGGSSDAAAALVAVNGLLGGPLGRTQLEALAGQLGSDVAFFIRGGTALGRGRGEVVEPLPDAPPLFAVLAAAGRKPSTEAVYAAHDRQAPTVGGRAEGIRTPAAVTAVRSGDAAALCAAVHNDLAAAARAVVPEISRVEGALRETGAMAVAVCGAGPTVFALYPGRERAAEGRADLAGVFPWVEMARFEPAKAGEPPASANPSPHHRPRNGH